MSPHLVGGLSHRELILNMPESKSSLSTLNGLTCLHIFSSSTFVTLADMPCSVSSAYLPLKFALLSTVNPFVKSLLPYNWCIQTLTNVMQLMLIGHGISCIIQRSFTWISETAWPQSSSSSRAAKVLLLEQLLLLQQTNRSAPAAALTVYKPYNIVRYCSIPSLTIFLQQQIPM